MNRNNRHMRYRRSVYRKNGIKLTLIACLCTTLAVLLAVAVIGNVLGKRVAERPNGSGSKSTTEQKSEHAEVRGVNAYPVPLSADGSTLSSRLSRVASDGYTDVCFELDSADGSVLYASDVAVSLGKQSSASALWKLSDVSKLCKDNGLYSIGIAHAVGLSGDNDLERTAEIGYIAAMTAEALRSGIDEVLIYADVTSERYGELTVLAESIHRLCPDGTVGIALHAEAFSESNEPSLLDSVWNSFDYLAVDLSSDAEDNEAVVENIDSTLGGMLYYLLRYNVRVLLPYSNDAAEIASRSQAVTSNGCNNMQIMPRRVV